jgi:probable HAF family extracellular repeat protein
MVDVGNLTGDLNFTVALAINNDGQIVGNSNGRAFLRTSDGLQDLGGLGDNAGNARGINNFGQVVGESGPAAILWTSDGGMTDLGVVSGELFAGAFDINDSNQVVGACYGYRYRPCRWLSGGEIDDLGDLMGGDGYGSADAINASGVMVGSSAINVSGNRHAVLWTAPGAILDLGDLPGGQDHSIAQGINDSGQVVGYGYVGNNVDAYRAFLWSSGGGMRDLNGLLDASGAGWTLKSAWAVNNAGQIVGYGINPDGDERAFLLDPVPERPLLVFTEFNEPPLGIRTFTPGPTAEEMGFVTTSSASGGASPLAGVAVDPGGSDSRVLSHRSINATTTFETVDIANLDDVFVSLRVQVGNTGYEAADFVRVYVTNNLDTIDLLNESGATGLNDLAGDGFLQYGAAIPNDWSQVALVITSSSNSSQAAERYDFDSIEFRGAAVVPEPNDSVLVAAGAFSLALALRRGRSRRLAERSNDSSIQSLGI